MRFGFEALANLSTGHLMISLMRCCCRLHRLNTDLARCVLPLLNTESRFPVLVPLRGLNFYRSWRFAFRLALR